MEDYAQLCVTARMGDVRTSAEERAMWVLCSGTLAFWMAAPLARSVRSWIPVYPDQAGRAETGRTPLPRVACRLKRGFETALRLALQWP
jgi:hypothetical protein